jgi:hypothetical protein
MAVDSRSKVRLGWIAAAAAPVLAVQAVRLFADSGVSDAAAAPTPAQLAPAVEPVPARSKTLTDEQRRAIDWLASVRSGASPVRSPIDTPAPQIKAPDPVPAVQEPPPLPSLRLGGVASRGKDVVASINNRLFARGDEPAQGWTIVEIDGPARAVTLERFDGQRFELTSNGLRELAAPK